jgi:uncharacterized membrane protein
MNDHYVSAVFDTQAEADRAVSELRDAGIDNAAISLIARHDGENVTTDGDGTETENATLDVIGKTALGAGIGTALGVAALAIPGVGPFIAAGAIAAVAVPGAALTGAAVGAAAGGLAGLFTDHGVSDDDARYYETRVGDGGIFLSVDARHTPIHSSVARDILYRNGGHNSTRDKVSMAM